MKILLKLFYNTILGATALIIVNLVGKLLSFHIALNLFTAVVVGILGLPGFILLIVLRLVFNIA